MEREINRDTPQVYQVNVVVLEGRHLNLRNATTYVVLRIGKRRKKIRAKSNKTDCPHFNDFCTFSFRLPLTVLLDQYLAVKVYQVSRYIRKMLGSFKVELATIWAEPNHQFYHKWAVLTDPKNIMGGPKGFLKCDIAILARGMVLKPPNECRDERMDQNFLVPYGTLSDRHRSKLVITVYRADCFTGATPRSEVPNYRKLFVKVTYGGEIRKTRLARNKKNPAWNQELTFLDLFPPLSQSIYIELCDRSRSLKRRSVGNTNIDISTLYASGPYGFLPTFGPNFLYLYRPFRKLKRHKITSAMENSFTYMGRLLLAIRMETIHYPEDVKVQKLSRKVLPQLIPPLIERNYFEYTKFVLFATVFNVLCFNTKYAGASVKFQVAMGPKHKYRSAKITFFRQKKKKAKTFVSYPEVQHVEITTACSSTKRKRCKLKDNYSHLTYSGKFPCVHVFGEWPNTLRKMYRCNVAKKALQHCAEELNKIKVDLEFEFERRYELSKKLKQILSDFSCYCEDILKHTQKLCPEDTNLFRERKKYFHAEIARIARVTKDASRKNALHVHDTVQKLTVYLATLKKFSQDPEDSFPDTEIWLWRQGYRPTQCRLKTEDIAFCKNPHERGMWSGKVQSVLVKGRKNVLRAKIDVFMWFGRADEFERCMRMLPGGFTQQNRACSSNFEMNIPSRIIYSEKHFYEFRVHLFQAKIFIRYSDNSLADPFVRVIVFGRNVKTKIRRNTLSPIFDETLVITSLALYGPPKFVKENPIKYTVELFDKEQFGKHELLGRAFVVPMVKLLDCEHVQPRLRWEELHYNTLKIGQILMVGELVELPAKTSSISDKFGFRVPESIRPHQVSYRVEVIFWGLRQIRRQSKLTNRAVCILEFGEHVIKSPILKNAKYRLNFPFDLKSVSLLLPVEPDYAPPLSVKVYHLRAFTTLKAYVASCIVPSIRYFYTNIGCLTRDQRLKGTRIRISEEPERLFDETKKIENWRRETRAMYAMRKAMEFRDDMFRSVTDFIDDFNCKVRLKCRFPGAYQIEPACHENMSWWMRYHASVHGYTHFPNVLSFKFYEDELEAQPEFNGFTDYLSTFTMVAGNELKKRTKVQAKLKAYVKVYQVPLGKDKNKFFDKTRKARAITNVPIRILVRVYIVCAKNLSPRDIYGKSDPYLFIQLGKNKINERKHYAPKQVNPVFGKCFEMKASFPHDSILNIKVIDFDSSSGDDLIGQTSIDIENRYYSKYHATCGIAREYHTSGLNAWRDVYHPTDILRQVCDKAEMDPPNYEKDYVVVGKHEFRTPGDPRMPHRQERQALKVLHSWGKVPQNGFHIVPEHVESRSLYHPKLPGIEQGKLQMWIDIFPADNRFVPKKIDITPQKPMRYELRAIVWSVDDVALVDNALALDDRISDIYVKGWMLSLEEDRQKTDVHFRSMNGEGTFNWRFIFRFNYIPAERLMLVRKKVDAFDLNPEEMRTECCLEIEIWDNDEFGHDYVGHLSLELAAMPKAAKLSSRCNLKMFSPSYTRVDLFKIRRTRGWWPCRRPRMESKCDFDLTGKVDLELEVLPEKDAMCKPVGLGRDEPQPLPEPHRPFNNYNWMLHPFRTFRYVVLRKFFKCFIFTVLAIIFVMSAFMYAYPNYALVKFKHS